MKTKKGVIKIVKHILQPNIFKIFLKKYIKVKKLLKIKIFYKKIKKYVRNNHFKNRYFSVIPTDIVAEFFLF